MGQIRVLNQKGDIKIEWDPADPASTAKAKEEWERLRRDGYRFYTVAESRGTQVQRFTKSLGSVLAAPGARSEPEKKKGARPKAMAGGPNNYAAALR